MVSWKIVFTKQAQKDAKKISNAGFRRQTQDVLNIVKENPFQNPPAYEKLVGDLRGAYSRRINIQRRLIYQVLKKEKVVKVMRMWTHYE